MAFEDLSTVPTEKISFEQPIVQIEAVTPVLPTNVFNSVTPDPAVNEISFEQNAEVNVNSVELSTNFGVANDPNYTIEQPDPNAPQQGIQTGPNVADASATVQYSLQNTGASSILGDCLNGACEVLSKDIPEVKSELPIVKVPELAVAKAPEPLEQNTWTPSDPAIA